MSDPATTRPDNRQAYVITGPTSGIGRRTALELSKHGTVVLVGRDRRKLDRVREVIERRGRRARSVVCDLSDLASVRRAAAEIVAVDLPIVGLLNNAGIMPLRSSVDVEGRDLAYATNHLGPFALTDAVVPHLPDGANVVFITSAVEDPARKPAVAAGFRGGRYISAEASARGVWKAGGSAKPGYDAYATSKQCNLATVLAFARQTPRLNFIAIEPGLIPTTGLGRDANVLVRVLVAGAAPLLVPLLRPFVRILSTPKRAAWVITRIVADRSGPSGVYYDEGSHPMQGSVQVRDPAFADRVVAETRALLASGLAAGPAKAP